MKVWLAVVFALGASWAASGEPSGDERARYVADIVSTAEREAVEQGIDPRSERVRFSVSNRLSKSDRMVLERLGVSETKLWVVYYDEETVPPSVGGDFTVYFREGSTEVVAAWTWD
jgi:hypothetical protein